MIDQAPMEAKEAYANLRNEFLRTGRADIKIVLDYVDTEIKYLVSESRFFIWAHAPARNHPAFKLNLSL
jgi:hypothetical protein